VREDFVLTKFLGNTFFSLAYNYGWHQRRASKKKITHLRFFSIFTAFNVSDREDFVLTKFLGRTFFSLA
jgi:hypothetical protein